ncbi:ATP-grasp domain-containing protein [Flavobacterium sp. TSSA_36]|uniref:ATP-grasp domain-containing protein n=1 Tax=Flavobacterium sp. TSSA_36 TaxID=3447669 RepID=UPI003F40D604
MNILITSAGQRVSLVRAFQNEIKKIDKDAKVYTVDFNPILAPACHISDGFDAIVKVTSQDYISKLLEICINRKIKLIIPTIDTELLTLSQNKDLFIQNGIIPIVSNFEFIQKCRDKRISNQFFIDNGIDIPKIIDKHASTFPLFIKPYDGSLSKDIFVIREKSELTAYHLTNSKLMFMEYIDPSQHDEYTVDTYYDKEGFLKCVVPRKRIFVRSGEVNKAVTHKNEIISFVKERLNSIHGAVGCLTMQFFFNSLTKRIVGIEINPRFGGGYPLSYLAGANFPKWLIQEYLFNKEIPFFEDWEANLLMLRYDDEVLIRNYE